MSSYPLSTTLLNIYFKNCIARANFLTAYNVNCRSEMNVYCLFLKENTPFLSVTIPEAFGSKPPNSILEHQNWANFSKQLSSHYSLSITRSCCG